MNLNLDFVLSPLFDGLDRMHPAHLADLRKSSLTDETIVRQKIRTVPPAMIDQLAGFRVPAAVTSAYVIPYPDPAAGWMDHIRMKLFPALVDEGGSTVKYIQPPRSGTRVFFALATLAAVLNSDVPLWVIEGEKKCLAIAQRGLPAVGIAGINCWNAVGSRRLHPDFDHIPLMGRIVELVPDSDWKTNPRVRNAVGALATALAGAGARPRIVVLPDQVSA
jgi:hypothetical protein